MVDLSDMLNAEIIIETENEFQTTTETPPVQEEPQIVGCQRRM